MEMCFYGCGREAKFMWGDKPCCSPHYMKCEANKHKSFWNKINSEKVQCKFCGRSLTKGTLHKHEESCKLNPTNIAELECRQAIMDKVCPICNRPHNGLYGSGVYCSERCARISATKNQTIWLKKAFCKSCKKEILVKKQASVDNVYCESCSTAYMYRKKWKCKHCQTPIKFTESGLCRRCLHRTPECRKSASEIMKAKVADGTHKGWKSRTKLEPSYAEKFFIEVLNSNKIPFVRELKVGKFFIDFAIEEKKIALEVDGKQHEYDDRKQSDVVKDEFLAMNGWRIHRIKWKSINSEEGKQYIKEEIERFLLIYNQ